jgi:hypothetical protein
VIIHPFLSGSDMSRSCMECCTSLNSFPRYLIYKPVYNLQNSIHPMDVDLKFKHPFISIISGPTGSGKTTFCVKFLKNLDTQCTETEFSGGIIWCYSEKTAVPYKDLINLKNIRYQEGLPDNFGDDWGKPRLLILHDLLNQVYSEAVYDLFTKGSHHRNVSVFLLTQNFFHQGAKCRDIS